MFVTLTTKTGFHLKYCLLTVLHATCFYFLFVIIQLENIYLLTQHHEKKRQPLYRSG